MHVVTLDEMIHAIKSIRSKHVIGFLLIVVALLLYIQFHTEPNIISVSVHTLSQKDLRTDVTLEYPEFDGVKSEFNKHIEKTVQDALATFRTSVAEHMASAAKSAGKSQPEYQYVFTQSFSPEQLSGRYLSMVIRTSYFTGGAHGGSDVYTFTYDREKKREITLEDIFGETPNYLHRISDYAQSDLKERLRFAGGGKDPDMTMLMQGLAPTKENFSRFTLGSNAMITFYFPAYQVAAYVFGEQQVTMPLSFILTQETLARNSNVTQ